MEFRCRVMAMESARPGLRRDERILIHEGDLVSNLLPTSMADDAHWLRLP